MKLELAMRLQRRTTRNVTPVVDNSLTNGRLLEDGTSFRLLEDGVSYRLLE